MRIGNANEDANYGRMNFDEQNADVAKGILFAVVGMLAGMVAQLFIGGVLEWRMGWITGTIMGATISLGYHIGKGREGITRQLTIVILSVVGAILGVWGGYAIYFYRMGWVRDLFTGFTFVSELFFGGYTEGDIAQDIIFGSIVAILVAWKAWESKGNQWGQDDLEVLYDTEETDDVRDRETRTSPMEDVLNQEIPTQEIPTLEFEDIDVDKL